MVTMKDIAVKAGVSRTVVSYVLNNVKANHVSAENREKVLNAARELGYQADDMARSMKTGKTKVIGVAGVKEDLLVGISRKADKHGYFLKFLPLDDRLVENARRNRLSGVILHLTSKNAVVYASEMHKYSIHVAAVGCSYISNCLDISTDNRQGMFLGLEHLYSLGHRKIAIVTGFPQDDLAMYNRLEAYKAFMMQKKLKTNIFSMQVPNYGGDYMAAKRSVKSMFEKNTEGLTAVICTSTTIANIVLYMMKEYAVNNISLVGYGRSKYAPCPYLTVIDEQDEKMGERAAELLINAIKNNAFEPMQEKFPAHLFVGYSTMKVEPQATKTVK